MVRVLTGKNRYALQQELASTIDEFIKNHGDSIERFDGEELLSADGVIDAVRSISFLEPRKLVVVRNFGQSKELLEHIEALVDSVADSTELILVDPQVDKRTTAYKYLKKHTKLSEHKELDQRSVEDWVIKETSDRGACIERRDARFLVERIGLDQHLLHGELDKLLLHDKTIDRASIELLTDETPQSKVFNLLDALFQGEVQRAWQLYQDQRAQGEEPHKIIAMIVWQLQQLVMAAYVPGGSKAQLVADGMSPYMAGKALDMVRRIDKRELRRLVKELSSLDTQTKTNADVESALTVYFSEFSLLQL